MELEVIKRGLRAEIKKRENEQYFTFQCNIRQMCKDVLTKLEEQEVEIADLKDRLQAAYKQIENQINSASTIMLAQDRLNDNRCAELRHYKYKRCLAMANYWVAIGYHCVDDKHRQRAERHHRKWLELANKFKNKETK